MPIITLYTHECVSPKNAKGADNQAFLALLREKGIPIIGGHYLAYHPDYEYKTQINDDTRTMSVQWDKRVDLMSD